MSLVRIRRNQWTLGTGWVDHPRVPGDPRHDVSARIELIATGWLDQVRCSLQVLGDNRRKCHCPRTHAKNPATRSGSPDRSPRPSQGLGNLGCIRVSKGLQIYCRGRTSQRLRHGPASRFALDMVSQSPIDVRLVALASSCVLFEPSDDVCIESQSNLALRRTVEDPPALHPTNPALPVYQTYLPDHQAVPQASPVWPSVGSSVYWYCPCSHALRSDAVAFRARMIRPVSNSVS